MFFGPPSPVREEGLGVEVEERIKINAMEVSYKVILYCNQTSCVPPKPSLKLH